MRKIITLIIFTLVMTLSSCGQATDQVVNNQGLNPSPSDEKGEMVDDSSTIILDRNTNSIESGAEGGTDGGDLSL